MERNEFAANRELAASRNAWAPVRAVNRGLSLGTVVRWSVAVVAAAGLLSALGVV